jgi:membrane fusion protein (multidrug efflux system)
VARVNLGSSEVGVTLTTSQTSASIGQAEAQLRVAQAGVASAEANAEKARTDLSRLERIYKEGGASKQQYDAAATSARTAEAAVAQARSQVAAAQEGLSSAQASTQNIQIKKSGVSTVQAQIKQAQAAVETAKLQLSHTTISAPADGLVVRKIAHAGEQVSPGQAIYSVAETDNVWVTAYVEETNIRRVREGAPVDVEIDAFPHRKFEGKVAFVNAVTGGQFSLLPANNAAGNFTKVVQRIPVKILVTDPNHELKPGMSAVIDIDAHQQ